MGDGESPMEPIGPNPSGAVSPDSDTGPPRRPVRTALVRRFVAKTKKGPSVTPFGNVTDTSDPDEPQNQRSRERGGAAEDA